MGFRFAVLGPAGIQTSTGSQESAGVGPGNNSQQENSFAAVTGPANTVISMNMSLRDQIDSAVKNIITFQRQITLQPSGADDYTSIYSLQNLSTSDAGVIQSISVDGEPGSVGLSIISAAYNVAPFGALNTSNNVLNSQWMKNNVLPERSTILVGKEAIIQFGFTNLTYYEQSITITVQLGLVDTTTINQFLASLGLNPIY